MSEHSQRHSGSHPGLAAWLSPPATRQAHAGGHRVEGLPPVLPCGTPGRQRQGCAARHAQGGCCPRVAPPGGMAGFTSALAMADQATTDAPVERWLADGVSAECLREVLLGPAANHLGRCWEDESASFVDVTIGLGHLHRIARDLAEGEPPSPQATGRAMILALPGDQHLFGALLVSHALRAAGWDVWNEPVSSLGEALDVVGTLNCDVVGVSVGSDIGLHRVANAVARLRDGSRNSAVKLMVGGGAFARHPGLLEDSGADALAATGTEAVERAAALRAGRNADGMMT